MTIAATKSLFFLLFLSFTFFCLAKDESVSDRVEKEILVHTWEDFILPELPEFINVTYRFLFTRDVYNVDVSNLAKRANPLTDFACYYIQTDGTTLVSSSGDTVINFVNPPKETLGYCAYFLLVNASNVLVEGISINMNYGESVIKLEAGTDLTLFNVSLESDSNVGLIYVEEDSFNEDDDEPLNNLEIQDCTLIQHHPTAPDIYEKRKK